MGTDLALIGNCSRHTVGELCRRAQILADGHSGVYLTDGIPRSLQIFFARTSLISLCLGTADRRFIVGFCHQE